MASEEQHNDEVSSVTWHPSSEVVASLSPQVLLITNVKERKHPYQLNPKTGTTFRECKYSPDPFAPYLYTIENKHQRGAAYLSRWDSSNYRREQTMRIARKPVAALATSPKGSLLAIGTSDGTVIVALAKNFQVYLAKLHRGVPED